VQASSSSQIMSTTARGLSTDDDAVPGVLDVNLAVENLLTTFGYPALRLLVALAVVWIASGVSS